MPGLIGFTSNCVSKNEGKQILTNMQDLITYGNYHQKDKLFFGENIYATRSHTNTIQKQSQPYHKSGIYVWLDGEFYNQNEIVKQLKVDIKTDPELLLALFEQHNDFSFLKNIDGIYSAVIYDSNQQKLYLITDRYGLRHLYWMVYNGSLVWSSEMKTFLCLPGFELKIDRLSVEEFFDYGYLIEDRSWFEGVELLSAATVLTWDIKEHSICKQRYWWWDEIKPLTDKINENEIAEELGRLFIDAVGRRSRKNEMVGLTLSGGLDSRAILAAMPDRGYPIHVVTFGKKGCDDVRIAAMAAKVKGAVHQPVEINAKNWLGPRLKGIWWLDGRKDLMHMHIIEAYREIQKYDLFKIVLDGLCGNISDRGCFFENDGFINYLTKVRRINIENNKLLFQRVTEYFSRIGSSHIFYIDCRLRSFTINGPKLATFLGIEYRLPFLDNNFQELLYSVPFSLRKNKYLYEKMLLSTFPLFYQKIPQTSTGFPIGYSEIRKRGLTFLKRLERKFFFEMHHFGKKYSDKRQYADYPNWIRQEPARSIFIEVLNNPSVLYPEYISQRKVLSVLERHFDGEDHSSELCRTLTFEIWLQQVFKGKYRSGYSDVASIFETRED